MVPLNSFAQREEWDKEKGERSRQEKQKESNSKWVILRVSSEF
jgi:hypothetical protein